MNIRPIFFTLLSILAALALSLSACADSFSGQPTQAKGDGEAIPASPGSTVESEAPSPSEFPGGETSKPDGLRPTHTLPGGLETVETPTSPPLSGEVPQDILDEIVSDIVERSGSARGDIQVIRAEAVVWNDGALGCPLPGEAYIQILIDGFWVVLKVEGIEYDYRVTDQGSFKLCEGEGIPEAHSPGTGQPGTLNLPESTSQPQNGSSRPVIIGPDDKPVEGSATPCARYCP